MEFVDEIGGMGEVFGWFPCSIRDRPAFPVDQVLKLASVEPGIQDLFDLVLFRAIDFDWWRRDLDAPWNIVLVHSFE